MALDSLQQPPQTNLALYRQLHALGYEAEQLRAVRDAYETAAELFAAQFRPSGKPFLAHLVGTAGILAAIGAAPAVVVAGLLHAAYDQGTWGWQRGPERRNWLGRRIGAAAEELVWRYHTLPWNAARVHAWAEAPGAIAPEAATILVMRLANELEDNVDLAMRQVALGTDLHRDQHAAILALAGKVATPELQRALDAAFRDAAAADWAAPLGLGRDRSFARYPAVVPRLLRRLVRTLRRR